MMMKKADWASAGHTLGKQVGSWAGRKAQWIVPRPQWGRTESWLGWVRLGQKRETAQEGFGYRIITFRILQTLFRIGNYF
jgi:hypothetical protein